MILLVDAGNTRVKWATRADPGRAGPWLDRGGLAVTRVADLAGQWAGLRPDWVGVSCVAGDAVRSALKAALQGLGAPTYWLQSMAEGFGIRNGYTRPEQLGCDRFASLVACQRLGLSPCVVASAGTALTVDALTGEGRYLGGIILPGMALMRAALQEGTAGVRELAGQPADFPTDTASGVETGIGLALMGAIGTMRDRLSRRLGLEAGLVLSGGDGPALARGLGIQAELRDDLVLEGLRWIALDARGANGNGE